MRIATALLVMLLAATGVRAIDAEGPLADPAQQARYERLTNELRCLVCQNQTVADSNADLAKDLRDQTRRMIEEGATDDEIIDFMTARYGDFVLYRPPVRSRTALLWAAPFLLLGVGIVSAGLVIRGRSRSGDIPEQGEEALPEPGDRT